jgi:hypothetical protein
MTYQYYSRKELQEIYNISQKTENLTFSTFYIRVRQLNWSIEKALTYYVKPLKRRK